MKKLFVLLIALTMLSTPAYSRYIPHGSVHNNTSSNETYHRNGLLERLKGKSVEGCEIVDVVYNYDVNMYANIICVKDGELNNIKIRIYLLMKENSGFFSNHVFNKEIKQLLGEQ